MKRKRTKRPRRNPYSYEVRVMDADERSKLIKALRSKHGKKTYKGKGPHHGMAALRAPHYTVSRAGMFGRKGVPGEIEISSGGVILLDEFDAWRDAAVRGLPEFVRDKGLDVRVIAIIDKSHLKGMMPAERKRAEKRIDELTKLLQPKDGDWRAAARRKQEEIFRHMVKPNRRKNFYLSKQKPKFLVSLPRGGEVWTYRKYQIELKRWEDKWVWEVFYSSGAVVKDSMASAADQTDALAAAKAEIDRFLYSGELSKKVTFTKWQVFDMTDNLLRGLAYHLLYEKGKVTRPALARELESRRGSPRYDYDLSFFDSLPLKQRLQWLDDAIANAKRTSRLAAKPNPKPKPKRRRPTQNPARAKAIMRRFMQV